jgi:hypothetical protein
MITGVGMILMRDELERVRDWAKGQIKIGSEAPASWDQYVTLIESADAILHEMAVAANLPARISSTCPGIMKVGYGGFALQKR